MQATAEATNLNGTGADMKAWLLDSNGNLAASRLQRQKQDSIIRDFKLLLHL